MFGFAYASPPVSRQDVPYRPLVRPGARRRLIGYRHAPTMVVVRGSTGLNRSDDPTDSRFIRADQEAMAAVAQGDEAAFSRMVDDHSPRLLRFARGLLTAGSAEAEEVVQEAFLRLWQQAESWQPNGRVSTWLHQVTYRLCIDNLRRRRPSVPIEDVGDELEEDIPSPDSGLMRAADVSSVREAVERLPERQRTALALFHFQELSQAEAASVMGIGESAFESLLARARRRLRVELSTDENEGGSR